MCTFSHHLCIYECGTMEWSGEREGTGAGESVEKCKEEAVDEYSTSQMGSIATAINHYIVEIRKVHCTFLVMLQTGLLIKCCI